ncbi:HAD family hydrolase [Arcanobacterium hippocoleae]|uniref:HAD family hydrolase n=1 Tax=Arcanobacterium hippocoleae TaxID=149017 RepID=UPI00333F50C0
MIKAAIFDMDGTLIDTMPVWSNAGANYLARLGVEVDPQLGKRFFEMTVLETAELIREEFSIQLGAEEIVNGIYKEVERSYREEAPFKLGAVEFVKQLAQSEIPMCIVSSGSAPLISAALERAGIRDCFTKIFGAAQTGIDKRQPTMFMQAAELMGADPIHTWVFEDALYAVRVVKPFGFRTVGIADELSAAMAHQLELEADLYWEKYPSEIPEKMLG